MSVMVCLPLFGDPAHELEGRVHSRDLRTLADSLRERLQHAADTLDKLTEAGWWAQVGAFDLMLSHPKVQTREQAEARLRSIGIDPMQLLIVEEIEDES
jgi:hypothetical protein